MTLDQLKTFVKIAELKSFSKAAKEVNLSQPSVSCHIIALEQELGTKLFDRLGKRILLTKPGETLLRYAKEMIDLEKRARMALNEILDIRQGQIKLGASNIPGAYILLPLIQMFSKDNPQVKIISTICDTEAISNEVLEGNLDLGVVGCKSDISQLVYYDFLEDVMTLVLNAEDPMAKRPSIKVDELKELPFIIREEGSGSRMAIEEALASVSLELKDLNIVAQLGNTEAIKQGIKSKMGVSIISKCAIRDEVKFGLFKTLPVEGITIKRYFYIIVHKTKSTLPHVILFKDFLLEHRKDIQSIA